MRSQMALATGIGSAASHVRLPYHERLPGLAPAELDLMPTLLCPPDHPLLEAPDKCSICLSLFQHQDRLRLLPVRILLPPCTWQELRVTLQIRRQSPYAAQMG